MTLGGREDLCLGALTASGASSLSPSVPETATFGAHSGGAPRDLSLPGSPAPLSRPSGIIALRTVWFEETGETRIIVRDCRICLTAHEVYGTGVVSPNGLAHIAEYEETICGHDATAYGWWWPL